MHYSYVGYMIKIYASTVIFITIRFVDSLL